MAAKTQLWGVIQAWLDQTQFPPTQSKLGKALGLSRSAISDWKYGKSRPTPEHLEALTVLFEPTLGPTTRDRLLRALLADMGYLVDDIPETARGIVTYVTGNDGEPVKYGRSTSDLAEGRGALDPAVRRSLESALAETEPPEEPEPADEDAPDKLA